MRTNKQFQSVMTLMRDIRKKRETIYYKNNKEIFACRVGTDFIELEDGTHITKDDFKYGNGILRSFYVVRSLNEI